MVVFTAQSKDEAKVKGVNKERCRKVEGEMEAAAAELAPLGVKVRHRPSPTPHRGALHSAHHSPDHSMQMGMADIEDLSAISSEFNVRKRMLPLALLYSVRARSAEAVPSDLFEEPSKLKVCRRGSELGSFLISPVMHSRVSFSVLPSRRA